MFACFRCRRTCCTQLRSCCPFHSRWCHILFSLLREFYDTFVKNFNLKCPYTELLSCGHFSSWPKSVDGPQRCIMKSVVTMVVEAVCPESRVAVFSAHTNVSNITIPKNGRRCERRAAKGRRNTPLNTYFAVSHTQKTSSCLRE